MFLVTSAVFYLHYLLFMIPRLGPQRDLDLFFMSYIVLTYTVGRLYLGREKEVEKAQECEAVFWSGLTAGAIIAVPLVVRSVGLGGDSFRIGCDFIFDSLTAARRPRGDALPITHLVSGVIVEEW